MIISKAIFILEDGLHNLRGYLHKEYNDAIDLAIKALKEKEAREKRSHK